MTTPRVVVLDYGSGNVHSAVKALALAGAEVELTADTDAVLGADGVVVPGVGAFAAVMRALEASHSIPILERRLAGGGPVLGICVGMQVLFGEGIEGGAVTSGMGEWPGTVHSLDTPTLPHIGWNTVQPGEGSALFDGIGGERFYFVHSFAATDWTLTGTAPLPEPVITWAEHEDTRFIAAVENGALSATQFHPEKSGPAGIALLRNWLGTLERH